MADKEIAAQVNAQPLPPYCLKEKVKKLFSDIVLGSTKANEWGVLIVDAQSLRILNSAVSMYEVLEGGIASIELLDSTREPLPEMAAIYFLSPCEESVKGIIADFSSSPPRYSYANVFFSSALSDELMSLLATSPAAAFIRQLKELNVEFIAFESQVFHFDSPESFRIAYFDDFADVRAAHTEEIATKLITVLSTLQARPSIIRHSSFVKDLAAAIQSKCDSIRSDGVKTTLLLLDRSFDWASPILHEFTYQAMIADLLSDKFADGVFHQEYVSQGGKATRASVIDERDGLFQHIRHMHIADTINWLVANRSHFTGETSTSSSTDLSDIAAKLHEELKSRDAIAKYSVHVDIAQLAMDQYKQRMLNDIALIEQDIVTEKDPTGKSVKPSNMEKSCKALLEQHGAKLQAGDVTRLLMLLALNKEVKESILTECIKIAKLPEESEQAIRTLRNIALSRANKENKVREVLKFIAQTFKKKQDAHAYDVSRYTPVLKTLLENLHTDKLSEDDFAKLIVSTQSQSRTQKPSWASNDTQAGRQVYSSRIVVFIVGGLTYSELRVVYELMKAQPKLEVVIGGTHIVDPNEFYKLLSL